MNTLYNNILKEAIKIYDFDSWNRSEKTFAKAIASELQDVFIYIVPEPKDSWQAAGRYIKVFSDEWPDLLKYCEKVYLSNGKKLYIYSDYNSGAGYSPKLKEGKYKIIIKDLDRVEDCTKMFFGCEWLISVPYFDTSRCEEMVYMFGYCKNLENVPLLNFEKVVDAYGMFANCTKLNLKTKHTWLPDEFGTPQVWEDDITD